MPRHIRFRKGAKPSDLRQVVVDGVIIGVAIIQDPRKGYRGLVARRIVFDPFNSWMWGGKQRIFQTLADLRGWLQRYTHGRR